MNTIVNVPTDSGQDSAEVSFCYKDAGDTVVAGDAVVELLTAKAAQKIDAPHAGKVAEIFVREGDKVVPGQPLFRVEMPVYEKEVVLPPYDPFSDPEGVVESKTTFLVPAKYLRELRDRYDAAARAVHFFRIMKAKVGGSDETVWIFQVREATDGNPLPDVPVTAIVAFLDGETPALDLFPAGKMEKVYGALGTGPVEAPEGKELYLRLTVHHTKDEHGPLATHVDEAGEVIEPERE